MASNEVLLTRSRGEEMTTEQRDDERDQRLTDPSAAVSDCEEAVQQLYAFLDGELTDELRRAFKAHLDACPPCVEVVTFEAELRRVIANKCQDRVPEDLRIRICAAISKEARGKR
jgi:anti-sigma factor (TIGR02949 family)